MSLQPGHNLYPCLNLPLERHLQTRVMSLTIAVSHAPPSLSGKTVATKEHLKAHKFDRVLCVTFRRSLAKKLTDDFGFVSYRTLAAEKQSLYKADHMVVQMDSVWRVENRPYSVAILDEALSIILHSRSTLMLKPTEVMLKLVQPYTRVLPVSPPP